MDTDEPSAAEPQPQRYGVRELVRAFGRRLVAVECGKSSYSPGPLEAALLWRQVAKAAKAVTSHRTTNSCRLCAELHPPWAAIAPLSAALLVAARRVPPNVDAAACTKLIGRARSPINE